MVPTGTGSNNGTLQDPGSGDTTGGSQWNSQRIGGRETMTKNSGGCGGEAKSSLGERSGRTGATRGETTFAMRGFWDAERTKSQSV